MTSLILAWYACGWVAVAIWCKSKRPLTTCNLIMFLMFGPSGLVGFADPADRFLSWMILLCVLMCSVVAAGEYRKEIGKYLFGPRPVVLRQINHGLTACASSKDECWQNEETGRITMRHVVGK